MSGDFLDWLIGIAMRLGAEISWIFVDFDNKIRTYLDGFRSLVAGTQGHSIWMILEAAGEGLVADKSC